MSTEDVLPSLMQVFTYGQHHAALPKVMTQCGQFKYRPAAVRSPAPLSTETLQKADDESALKRQKYSVDIEECSLVFSTALEF